jgi:hypothetical protein
MRAGAAAICMLALLIAAPAGAHRLDEYLQATTIAVEKRRVEVEIRLAPGVSVFPLVFADIDSDGDGVASPAEQRAYAERVIGDLSLIVDGRELPLRQISSNYAPRELLQEGRGDIQIKLEADVRNAKAKRRLTFENRHQSGIGSYLVNGLMPHGPDIQLAAQNRSYDQSFYQLDYTDASAPLTTFSLASWPWMHAAVMTLIVGLVLFLRHKRPAIARTQS